MRFGGASSRTGARGTLHRPEIEPPGFGDAFESRQNITCGAHVSRLFLNPDDLARIGMLLDRGGNFRSRQRVKLVKKENRRIRVLAAAAFGTELMADFSAGDQDAAGILHFAVRNQRGGAPPRKILDVLAGIRMAQEALWREYDERLSAWA